MDNYERFVEETGLKPPREEFEEILVAELRDLGFDPEKISEQVKIDQYERSTNLFISWAKNLKLDLPPFTISCLCRTRLQSYIWVYSIVKGV